MTRIGLLALFLSVGALQAADVWQLAAPNLVLYENALFEYSVELPSGYQACVERYRPYGVTVRLDGSTKCETRDDDVPRIEIWGAEPQIGERKAAFGSPHAYCDLFTHAERVWLRRRSIGNLPAEGFVDTRSDGRKISLLIARAGTKVFGARLITTRERYRQDNEVFQQVLAGFATNTARTFVVNSDTTDDELRQRGWNGFGWDPLLYRNVDYEFSVILPHGYLSCVDWNTNHGTWIPLDPASNCEGSDDLTRDIRVFADYAAWTADGWQSMRDRAIYSCLGGEASIRSIEWLHEVQIGDHRAEGCRATFADGSAVVALITFRGTKRGSPWPKMEIEARLTTTRQRFDADYELFRTVLAGVWIHADGPYDGRVGFRRP